jgi:RNA polymerase sigma factor (sigma-70 family)
MYLPEMSILDRIFRWLSSSKRRSQTRLYELDQPLNEVVGDLSLRERRSADAIVSDLVEKGLNQLYCEEALVQQWQGLSPRERDVTALVCLGYTNRQIASRLDISTETVKTHLRNVLMKLHFRSRTQLALIFENWDFSEWDH